MLQYRQPWALLVVLATLALQILRMNYEEQVLSAPFPNMKLMPREAGALFPACFDCRLRRDVG